MRRASSAVRQAKAGSDLSALPRPAMNACTRWTVSSPSRGYFFFDGGVRNDGPTGTGFSFSAFGLRTSRLLALRPLAKGSSSLRLMGCARPAIGRCFGVGQVIDDGAQQARAARVEVRRRQFLARTVQGLAAVAHPRKKISERMASALTPVSRRPARKANGLIGRPQSGAPAPGSGAADHGAPRVGLKGYGGHGGLSGAPGPCGLARPAGGGCAPRRRGRRTHIPIARNRARRTNSLPAPGRVPREWNRFCDRNSAQTLQSTHDSTIRRFRLIASCSRRRRRGRLRGGRQSDI